MRGTYCSNRFYPISFVSLSVLLVLNCYTPVRCESGSHGNSSLSTAQSSQGKAVAQDAHFDFFVKTLTKTLDSLPEKESASRSRQSFLDKGGADPNGSKIKTALSLLPKSIYDIYHIDDFLYQLSAQEIPPKGWKWGPQAWNQVRRELSRILRSHQPFIQYVLKPFFIVSPVKNQDSLIMRSAMAQKDPVTKALASSPAQKMMFESVNAEGLAHFTNLQSKNLLPEQKTALFQYLSVQQNLPELFANTTHNQEKWASYRNMVLREQQLTTGALALKNGKGTSNQKSGSRRKSSENQGKTSDSK